jgi:hypothetical protein
MMHSTAAPRTTDMQSKPLQKYTSSVYVHVCVSVCTYAYTHNTAQDARHRSYTCMHTYIHTYIHANNRMRSSAALRTIGMWSNVTHKYIRTYIHTHMQANNRMHSSAALRTTDMWSNVIGDDFGKANDAAGVGGISGSENAYEMSQNLMALARLSGQSNSHVCMYMNI